VNFLSRIALHRAAKAYAKYLPGELEADWGASGSYTVDQVRAAIERRNLKGRYVALAYAAFLTEADYLKVAPSLPLVLPYDIARDVFQRAKPWGDRFTDQRDSEATSAPPGPYTYY
jgi:hypothetical protein